MNNDEKIVKDLAFIIDFYENHFTKFIELVSTSQDKKVQIGESFYYLSQDCYMN